MSKLIITIISIGIAAAAGLMATDYISSIYLNGSARAAAQAWLTEAAEITAAARQAGSLSLTSDDWKQGSSTGLVAAALVPTYLSDLPKHSGSYVFEPCTINGSGVISCPVYTTDTTHATDATILMAVVENQQVCQEIQRLANRDSIILSSASTSPQLPVADSAVTFNSVTLPTNSNQQFTCIISNNGPRRPGTGIYYFFYRVFLDR